MEYKRLTSIEDPLFAEWWTIYTKSFPQSERRLLDHQARVMQYRNYYLFVIVNEQEVIGILAYWIYGRESDKEYIFGEHFAILPTLRNGGIGKEVVTYLKELGYPFIFEVEPAIDELTSRRKQFYKRNGFIENPHKHKQPPYRNGDEWLPLTLMSYPKVLSAEEYEAFFSELSSIHKANI